MPSRPTTQDLPLALLSKLSRGHPGAAVVLYQIFLKEPDPYDALRAIDGLGWEGGRIWEVYKDGCEEDLQVFVRLVKNKKLFG